MPATTPGPSFVPALPILRRARSSWALILVLVIVFVIILVSYFLFTKPETVPSAILFEKLFPSGSAIRELEKINLDIDGILQHPVLRTLEERVPLPLQIPPAGKPNPFI